MNYKTITLTLLLALGLHGTSLTAATEPAASAQTLSSEAFFAHAQKATAAKDAAAYIASLKLSAGNAATLDTYIASLAKVNEKLRSKRWVNLLLALVSGAGTAMLAGRALRYVVQSCKYNKEGRYTQHRHRQAILLSLLTSTIAPLIGNAARRKTLNHKIKRLTFTAVAADIANDSTTYDTTMRRLVW